MRNPQASSLESVRSCLVDTFEETFISETACECWGDAVTEIITLKKDGNWDFTRGWYKIEEHKAVLVHIRELEQIP